MKNIIILISTLALVLGITACNKSPEQADSNSDVRLDSFISIDANNDTNSSNVNLDNLNIAESYKDKYDEPEYSNHNDEYKDNYESNIEVDVSTVYSTSWVHDWFIIPDDLNYLEIVYQWVAYAILEYYDGDVPERFEFNADSDIIHQETNMIYTVLVTGESTNLNILLDTYNYKIIVTEVD